MKRSVTTAPQPGRRATTAWNLVFQYLTVLITLVSVVILVPLYLKYISIERYGAWLASGNILAWITAIDPGLSLVIQQRIAVAYGKKDSISIIKLINSGIILAIILSAIVVVVGLLITPLVPSVLKLAPQFHEEIKSAFIIAVIGSGALMFSFAVSSVNTGLQATRAVGAINVSVQIGSVVLTIIMLLKGCGVISIPAAIAFRGVLLTFLNMLYLKSALIRNKIAYKFCLKGTQEVASLTIYTFLSRLGNTIANSFDAVLISRFLGPTQVAVLEITRRIPNFSRLVAERPSNAIMPAVSHLVGTGEWTKARNVLLRLIRIEIWLLGLIVSGFVVYNEALISLWVGPELFAGYWINLIICITMGLWGLLVSLANLCLALGDIKGNSIANFIQGILQLLFVWIGVSYYGLIGVVIASLIAKLSITVWYFPRSFVRLLRIETASVWLSIRELAAITSISTILCIIFSKTLPTTWFELFTGLVVFMLSYVLLCVLVSKQFRHELTIISNRIKAKFFRVPN